MEPCTLCFGGTEPTNLGGTSAAGGSCSFLAQNIQGAEEGTPGCRRAQLNAFQGCGCPAYDESVYCTLCDDGFYEIENRNKPVPLFGDDQCGDILFTERESGRCDDLTRAAYHCGCPGAPEPICSFCALGDMPDQASSLLPPTYELSCHDLHELAPFSLTNETCAALTGDLPIHADLYCGCVDDDPDFVGSNCSLCGTNETIPYADWLVAVSPTQEMTCAQLGRLTQVATDDDFCTSLVDDFYNPCCLGIRPSESPTMAPSADEVPTTESPTVPESGARRYMAADEVSSGTVLLVTGLVSLWLMRGGKF